jgi:hypothetical protein
MESQIKKVAKEIAKEIAERPRIMDIDSVATMIEMRIKLSMLDFVSEYSTKEEGEYLQLLTLQSKQKVGTPEYNKIAYKLTEAKAKKAAANRAVNNISHENKYQELKKWFIEKYGRETFDTFISEKASQFPIYSTNKI